LDKKVGSIHELTLLFYNTLLSFVACSVYSDRHLLTNTARNADLKPKKRVAALRAATRFLGFSLY